MRILVVDDEKDQLKAICLGLRSCGFDTEAAKTGRQALTMLEQNDRTVDLVITDFAMPEMNGIQLLQKIRKNHPSIPVILISAIGSDRLAEDAYKSGVRIFLNKPFQIEELVREISYLSENPNE